MKALNMAVVAVLLATGTTIVRADQTNLVENIQIRLQGLKQGNSVTNRNQVITSVEAVRLENRQVIQALGTATGNSFSQRSRLVLVSPVDGGSSSVQVRDGNSKVDVTGFFTLEQTGTSVIASIQNTRTGRSNQTIYSVQRFALHDMDGALSQLTSHFDVSGFGADFAANHPVPGPDNNLNIDVNGNGDRDGSPLVIQGSITISGQTQEVVADEDEPNV